ncbi:MAG: phosphoglycerate kinase [Micavibrio aeruginosavorus]|uniref:Phosphoglycerate kinase n=1 Tax=Micavibrio aeruginosavorus TaxID=349221 RepID=A0A2W5FQB3_9BACT|nr:MAG: phosphoglycerate kinase [Micavibrio aeruginosavorus]
MDFQSLKTADVKNKFVLLRVDLNVPAENGEVTDTTRIDRLKPTIEFLAQMGAKTIILSHFGRPKGVTPEFSLEFLLPALEESWERTVKFAHDSIGEDAQAERNTLNPGEILLLENIRFHPEEEKNDPDFAKELAKLGDIYVNDAFSAAHRAHASTEGVAHFLPTYAGFLMEEELTALNRALGKPERPLAAIVGGSKISTKLDLLNNLVTKADYLILGGGMATTFAYALGAEVGKSLCEQDMKDQALAIMEKAKANKCEIILPVDRIVVKEFGKNVPFETVDSNSIPADMEGVDIGPEAVKAAGEKLEKCKTVIWNGPMGVFEVKPFDNGTNGIAQIVADLTESGKIVSVAGGGDTVSALENAGVADKVTYMSSAGGAFLEWMEGKTLPGVAALSQAKKAA